MFAVCAIARNEPEHYVREWLDWHRKAGVDRFFIYDNGGWCVTAKDVVVRPIFGRQMQIEAYRNGLKNCDDADFLAFIDIDEFLMGPILDRLPSIENALALNWKTFGTSGLEWNPIGRAMGTFTCHLPARCPINGHVKSIVRPKKVSFLDNPHAFKYDGGMHEDFSGNKSEPTPLMPIETWQAAWVNHYFTRSIGDWREKVCRSTLLRNVRRFETVFVIDGACVEIEGGGKVDPSFLPYVACAQYGIPSSRNDVAGKIRKMAEQGSIQVEAGKYNALFGDPAFGRMKSLYLRFERNGFCVGEVKISEDETLAMP